MVDGATGGVLKTAFWVPLAVCTWLALSPSPPDLLNGISDVPLHGFAFLYLSFALVQAYYPRALLIPALWMLAFGAALELVQGLIPERDAEWKDLMVDALGVGMGLGLGRTLGGQVRGYVARLMGFMKRVTAN